MSASLRRCAAGAFLAIFVGTATLLAPAAQSTAAQSPKATTDAPSLKPGAQVLAYKNGDLVPSTPKNFDATKPTFVITHGWNGLYTKGKLTPSYVELADSLPAGSNVLFVTWSQDSDTGLNAKAAAAHISADAALAYAELQKQTALGSTPSLWQNVTMIGSSFGAYLNAQIAHDVVSDPANGGQKVGMWMGLDPANTFGLSSNSGFPKGCGGLSAATQSACSAAISAMIRADFDNSASLHTYSYADNQTPLGNQSVLLLDTAMAGSCYSHTWCLNFIVAHGYGRTWLADCLSAGTCTLGSGKAPQAFGLVGPTDSITGLSASTARSVEKACGAFDKPGYAHVSAAARKACVAAVVLLEHKSAVADFSGTWKGTYSATIYFHCGPVSETGSAYLTMTQTGTSVSGSGLELTDWIILSTTVQTSKLPPCKIAQRTDESDQFSFALTVSGTTASGDGWTLDTSPGAVSLTGTDSGYDTTGYRFTTSVSLTRVT